MIIDVSNIKTLQKSITLACPRTDDKFTNSIYLNFLTKQAYVHKQDFIGQITFDWTENNELDTKLNGIYFDISKFFVVLNSIPGSTIELYFKEIATPGEETKYFPLFVDGKNEYTISHIVMDMDFVFSEEEYSSIPITDEIVNSLNEASLFTDVLSKQFSTVIYEGTEIQCVTPTRMYFTEVSQSCENPLSLTREVIKVLSSLVAIADTIEYNKSSLGFKGTNFRFLYSSLVYSDRVATKEDVAKVTSKDHFIEFNRKDFMTMLKFFDSFYSQDSKPIGIKIVSETEMELSVVSTFDNIKKVFPLEKASKELINLYQEYNASILMLALSVFDTASMRVYLGSTPEILGCIIEGVDKEGTFIFTVKYEE